MSSVDDSKRRSQKRQRFPLVGLLVVAASGAGVLAYFGSREDQTGSSREVSPVGSEQPRLDLTPGDPKAGKHSPHARPTPPPSKPSPALGENEVPTEDEARKFRRNDALMRTDIRDRGVEALAEDISCEPPTRLDNRGLKEPGGVGCVLENSDGLQVRVGRWVLRDPRGELSVGAFENGERAGEWKSFHASGYPASKGEYDFGRRHGEWLEWDEQGIHAALRHYDQGRLHGVTIRWLLDATIVELWKEGELVSQSSPEPEPDEG